MTPEVNSKIWMTKYRSKKRLVEIKRNFIDKPFSGYFLYEVTVLARSKVRLLLASIYVIIRKEY